MPFDGFGHVRLWLALTALCVPSCASEGLGTSSVEARASPLELQCAAMSADVVGDVTAILSSTEPLDASQPQAYGSNNCSGLIFEFDNPDEEELRGAWIQASGEASVSSGVLGSTHCADRALEADYWGFKKKEWSKLASATTTATFEPGTLPDTGYCRLEGLIEHTGTFEKLRIIARVTQGSETYPMYAIVW